MIAELKASMFLSSVKRSKISVEPTLALAVTCLPGYDLALNSSKLVYCFIDSGSVHHNCGPVNRTVSKPYITDLTLSE